MTDYTPTPYRPAWWLPGAHAQTLGARFMRRTGGVRFRRERFELSDGDFVDLDEPVHDEGGRDDRPLVLLLHGLEGSARSRYALETYRWVDRVGMRAVGLNFRSCSGELNRLPQLYHSGETGDIAEVIDHLRGRTGPGRLGVIGFSLGGNALLKFLGESGDGAREWCFGAAAISVPYDLSAGADYLQRPGGVIYRTYLLRKLQRKLRAKRDTLPAGVNVHRALRSSGFRGFDDAATAPLHGFDGAEDYYRRSSSQHYLESIRVPTLLIHAEDDPFVPPDAMPRSIPHRNPVVRTAFTRRGGHVGFVSGPPWRPLFWAEAEAARFISTVSEGPEAAG